MYSNDYKRIFVAFIVITRNPLLTPPPPDRKSTRLNSSHSQISYAVFCLKKKKNTQSLLASYVHAARIVVSCPVAFSWAPRTPHAIAPFYVHAILRRTIVDTTSRVRTHVA